MPIEIGKIEAIYRYPVKSMRGESLAAATLGPHQASARYPGAKDTLTAKLLQRLEPALGLEPRTC